MVHALSATVCVSAAGDRLPVPTYVVRTLVYCVLCAAITSDTLLCLVVAFSSFTTLPPFDNKVQLLTREYADKLLAKCATFHATEPACVSIYDK